MIIIDAEKFKQYLKENIADVPMNLPDMYWTKGWNAGMAAIYNKVVELLEAKDDE